MCTAQICVIVLQGRQVVNPYPVYYAHTNVDPDNTGNYYTPYNKPYGVMQWLADAQPVGDYFLLVDPDMTFQRCLSLMPPHLWLYVASSQTLKLEHVVHNASNNISYGVMGRPPSRFTMQSAALLSINIQHISCNQGAVQLCASQQLLVCRSFTIEDLLVRPGWGASQSVWYMADFTQLIAEKLLLPDLRLASIKRSLISTTAGPAQMRLHQAIRTL